MNDPQLISPEQFSKRLVELCLRSNLAGIPKKDLDQHILLKSAVLLLDSAQSLSEKEISARLEVWVHEVCPIQNFDRVSLRRWLIDTGYVTRTRDGAVYQVAQPGPGAHLFAAEIDRLDIPQVIAAAREEIVRRKQEFMRKSKEG
jgi:hypothetical protein